MKFWVKFDSEFNLKVEISDGKNLVKFGGRTLPARKARKISGRISGQFRENFGANFGNFVSNFAIFLFRKLRSAEGRC